ncbi:MAG TPA: CheR family methyltransferase [Cyclobacteriaceae bacterium]|jgi:chemotaxis protein methyltransferase CheR|nr:CheR family methyltransferase [Cyclobacteriaceae bacterium]
MDNSVVNGILSMDDASFARLSVYVTREYGIKLPESKKSMLESRLNKKVKSLGLSSYKEFLDFIFSEEGKKEELFNVIDLITTNKTDFFREAAHFQFLTSAFLPEYKNELGRSNLKIWSAGCSTGEEPYTIIMAMEEYKKKNPDTTYSLLASDVSIRVIQTAHQAVYEIEKIDPVPIDLKRNYFLRSKANPKLVRVKPQFRNKLQFKRINFMDSNYGLMKSDFDVIFCRNVLIYFDKATQERVILKFCSHLKPGGLLFLGHSESIIGMNLPLKQIRPTVYRFEG